MSGKNSNWSQNSIENYGKDRDGKTGGLRREVKRMGRKSIYEADVKAAKFITPEQEMRGFSEKAEYPGRRDLQILTTGDSPREEDNLLPALTLRSDDHLLLPRP